MQPDALSSLSVARGWPLFPLLLLPAAPGGLPSAKEDLGHPLFTKWVWNLQCSPESKWPRMNQETRSGFVLYADSNAFWSWGTISLNKILSAGLQGRAALAGMRVGSQRLLHPSHPPGLLRPFREALGPAKRALLTVMTSPRSPECHSGG